MADAETVVADMQAETDGAPPDSGEPERGKSTIQFPYLDLSEAIKIAKGVHTEGGNSCQVDQLAARLQEKADAPKFRQKLGTSKMFGLITYGAGTIALTPLGIRINDPQQEAAAKAEAFLLIPLYKQVYEQFRGGNLPPTTGLENAVVTMGVAPKQKANARQVFFRSATQAGFFTHGTNRLVPPSVKAITPSSTAMEVPQAAPIPSEPPTDKNGGEGGGGNGGKYHPFIEGLLATMAPSSLKGKMPWSIEERAQWLQAAISVFNLLYEDKDGGTIEIKHNLKRLELPPST